MEIIIHYLFLVLCRYYIFSLTNEYSLLLVVAKTLGSINIEQNNQSSTEKNKRLFSIELINDADDPSSLEKSSRYCKTFNSCPFDLNGTIGVFGTAVIILLICFRFSCYEYCGIKKQLDDLSMRNPRQRTPNNICVNELVSFV